MLLFQENYILSNFVGANEDNSGKRRDLGINVFFSY